MKFRDFGKLIKSFCLLTPRQREKCIQNLQTGSQDSPKKVPQCLAEAIPRCCPHCKHDKLWKHGRANGLQRWRCQKCRKTCNGLTGTPLARLRKKEKWLENADAMIAGLSVRKTAVKCEVHPNTSFRWRHRFLECQQKAQCKDLSGIAESDTTYFRISEKGSKNLKRKPRKRGGHGSRPGINKELVALLTLRDRTGKGAERLVAEDLSRQAAELYKKHLHDDTLLLTDGGYELRTAAKSRNPDAHMALIGKKSRGEKSSPYHLQTNNGYHAKLKIWMARFHGVATKYLSNYAGWFRHLFEGTHKNNGITFIKLSFSPLAVNPQLTVT